MRREPAERLPVRGLAPLKTVGHPTPRIDAVERVTGAGRRTPRDVVLPGMLFARVLRSPHPHARIRSIDASKAQALPGVKAILTHENCRVVWGAGSIAGGQQYNDEVKKITTQRRYAFNNPVRFVGEPVAAVAAVDRHVAEEALALIAVDYELLPFVLDMNEALTPEAPKIWPEGNLSPNNRNESAADRRAARRRRRGAHDLRPRLRGSLYDRLRAQRADGAAGLPGALGRRQAHRLHADRRHRQLPARHGPRPRHPGRDKVRVVCEYMGGNFGNKNQNQDADLIAAMLAKEAGAPVQAGAARARRTSSACTAAGRRRSTTRSAAPPTAR